MTENTRARRAVVTGASTGIGRATVVRLRDEGWDVIAVARRADRLDALAAETGCTARAVDVTDAAAVDELAAALTGEPLDAVVHVAGGARGVAPIATGSIDDWRWMYEVNVLGTLRLTQALLPSVQASGGGDIVVLSSTAATQAYEGGGGYVAAKHAEHTIAATLRLELAGQPVRVIEIQPGLVATEEFALRRLGGDEQAAAKVYDGVENPLTGDDVADCIAWALARPRHVNIDTLVVRPIAQAANYKLMRNTGL